MNERKAKYNHEWRYDFPWHMVNLRDWFYMVNVGDVGVVFLHVRILGIRSLWTILDFPGLPKRRFDDCGEPLQAHDGD